jgi:hypothetical protein
VLVFIASAVVRTNFSVQFTEAVQTILTTQDEGDRQRLLNAFEEYERFLAECTPLLQEAVKAQKTQRAADKERFAALYAECTKRHPARIEFGNTIRIPYLQALWILIEDRSGDALLVCVAMIGSVVWVFYFLTLGILISRVYSRWAGIESFVLPVGFAFTALGQSIKLVLVFT